MELVCPPAAHGAGDVFESPSPESFLKHQDFFDRMPDYYELKVDPDRAGVFVATPRDGPKLDVLMDFAVPLGKVQQVEENGSGLVRQLERDLPFYAQGTEENDVGFLVLGRNQDRLVTLQFYLWPRDTTRSSLDNFVSSGELEPYQP